jgi:hypothetical protein
MTNYAECTGKPAAARLFRDMLGAGIVYIAAVLGASLAIKGLAPPQWVAALLALAPIAPALLMLSAQLRHMRTLDEFQRRVQSEAVLIAAGLTAFATLAYGQLEDMAGFPDISMMWVFPALCVAWSIAKLFVQRRYTA